jgi:hypothetical protein
MPKNIKTGFTASGLFPFNPNRVFKGILKPSPILTIPKINKAMAKSYLYFKVLQTPVMSVLKKALILLQNRIIKWNIYALDKINKQSLYRHIRS